MWHISTTTTLFSPLALYWAGSWLLVRLMSSSRDSSARLFSSLMLTSKKCCLARFYKKMSWSQTSRANERSLTSPNFKLYVQPWLGCIPTDVPSTVIRSCCSRWIAIVHDIQRLSWRGRLQVSRIFSTCCMFPAPTTVEQSNEEDDLYDFQ